MTSSCTCACHRRGGDLDTQVKAQRDGHVSLPLHPPHTIPAAAYFRDSHILTIDKQFVNIIWKEKLSIRRRCDQNRRVEHVQGFFFLLSLWIVWLSLPGVSDAGLQNACQPSLGPEIGHWRFPLLRCAHTQTFSPCAHISIKAYVCAHGSDKP